MILQFFKRLYFYIALPFMHRVSVVSELFLSKLIFAQIINERFHSPPAGAVLTQQRELFHQNSQANKVSSVLRIVRAVHQLSFHLSACCSSIQKAAFVFFLPGSILSHCTYWFLLYHNGYLFALFQSQDICLYYGDSVSPTHLIYITLL